MTLKSLIIVSIISVSILLLFLYNFVLPGVPYEITISEQVNAPQDDLSICEFFITDFVPHEKATKIFKLKAVTETPFPWKKYEEAFPDNLILVRKKDEGKNEIIIFFDNNKEFEKFVYCKL
jgi:hypothetical protein